MPKKTGATQRLEQVAHRMWLDGATDPEIAAAVGCSKTTVFNWRYARGLEPNGGHGTPQRTMAFKSRMLSQRRTVDCWQRWLTDAEAAAELGIARAAYTQRRNRLKLPNRRKMKQRLKRLSKDGREKREEGRRRWLESRKLKDVS